MIEQPHELEDLQALLMQIMVRLIVRHPNGMMIIEQSLHAVREAGSEMDIVTEFDPITH